uniref:Leucine rich immune protein (Short) n=1 Tax=Anopheles epiroticus TaxID=199890 RepID=A0A182PQG6_9DIPT
MTITAIITLGVLATFVGPAFAVITYRCDVPDTLAIKATCLMRNVTLLTVDDIDETNFLMDMRYVALAMRDGFIPHFTRPLALKYPQVQDLTVDTMGIRSIFIWSKLEQLSARNNSIRVVNFAQEAGVQHRLRSLRLDDNELSTVPSFGRSFNELKYLSLDGNRLEQVALDAFAGLEQLQRLSLARNGMILVEPSTTTTRLTKQPIIHQSVQLLKLKDFSLASNRLITVNISGWDMPSLVSLDVSHNDLYLLLDEPHQIVQQFGALLDISYAGNDWQCGWLSEAQLALRKRCITAKDQDTLERCEREQMKSLSGICCYERAFEKELTQEDQFKGTWEKLNDLWRRYELVQLSYNEVQDSDLNLIIERAHELRGQLMGSAAQDQDEIEQELVRLRYALDEERAHLERLEQRIERAVLELGQAIDDLHERAVRPKPTLDAVRLETIGYSIEQIKGSIESLRHKVQDYVFETSERDKRIRRYGERIELLEQQLAELKRQDYSQSERTGFLRARVDEAYRVIENIIPRNTEEMYDRIQTPRVGSYFYQMYRG